MQVFTGNFLYNSIGIILALITTLVLYFKWTFTYWQKRGLYNPKPTLIFGNTKDWILQKITVTEQFGKFYKEFKSKNLQHGAIYLCGFPCYIPIDIEIIKNILCKDCQYFMNRGVYINEQYDPLTANLFALEDDKWKCLRAKLTPTFTSGKIKMMFQTMLDCTKELDMTLKSNSKAASAVDIKEVVGGFTTNVIGSCAFGLECESFKDADSPFYYYGKRVFENTTLEGVKAILSVFLPRPLLEFFHFKANKADVERFFLKLIRDTVDYREKNNVYRPDFLHLLLQLKNRGKLSNGNNFEKISNDGLTINEIAAQSYAFFAASFETSSTTMTFALFELTQNLEIQTRVRNEINKVLGKYEGNLTYEACMGMNYLDKVVYETLRKYPPIPVLPRVCNRDYTIPNSNILIENGTKIMIPVLSIQYDSDYYPDPEKFDPERFSEENKQSRPACTFLAFGEGPRICIGLRFGLLQTKLGLITILKNYKVSLNEKTTLPLKYDCASFALSVKGGVWLNLEKIV